MARHSRRKNEQLARDLKSGAAVSWADDDSPTDSGSFECDECGRAGGHADWCLAEDIEQTA